jgi:hypothetical protein
VRLYVLHLEARAGLSHAFDRVMDHPEVLGCSVESALRRLRFIAPRGAGEELVEAIYLEGSLVWCTRHVYQDVDAAALA